MVNETQDGVGTFANGLSDVEDVSVLSFCFTKGFQEGWFFEGCSAVTKASRSPATNMHNLSLRTAILNKSSFKDGRKVRYIRWCQARGNEKQSKRVGASIVMPNAIEPFVAPQKATWVSSAVWKPCTDH